MSLAPLLNAAPAIQLHAFSALAAFGLGAMQLAAPKGTLPHRTLGWIWVLLMVIVAASSFWIHELRVWGAWSPIHHSRSSPSRCCRSPSCTRGVIASAGIATP